MSRPTSPLPLLVAAFALTMLQAGCAPKPPASEPDELQEYYQTNDPAEPTNRVFYAINNGLDTVILRPLAVAYRAVVPEVVRTHAHDFLTNLSEPVALFDDMLQARPRRAGDSLMRLLVNTTVGVGGVFDVATGWGWPVHDTDAGITFALWGLPNGPYLFLPVLGPSSPRDATGFGSDIAMDPLTWIGQGAAVSSLGYARYSLNAVDARARVLDDLDKIKQSALDPYATIRSLYQQHRQSQIDEARSGGEPATVPAWFAQPRRP